MHTDNYTSSKSKLINCKSKSSKKFIHYLLSQAVRCTAYLNFFNDQMLKDLDLCLGLESLALHTLLATLLVTRYRTEVGLIQAHLIPKPVYTEHHSC